MTSGNLPSHRCQKPKLYIIEDFYEDPGVELQEILLEDPQATLLELAALTLDLEISLHAMIGTVNPKTMRVVARVGTFPIVVFIDSGSTHNFLDLNIM